MASDAAKVCVITGCSSGIGLYIALALSESSARTSGTFTAIIATLRTPSQAPAALSRSRCDIQALDVTDDASVRALAQYVRTQYGGCAAVVNNAGIGVVGTTESVLHGDALRMFDVNVWGVVRMCREFAPLMRVRGGGLFSVVSSTSGVASMPYFDTYAASKFAVEGLMESYRYAVERDNIKVVLFNPGPTATPFGQLAVKESLLRDNLSRDDAHWMNLMTSRNDSGQDAEGCAKAIVKVIVDCVDVNIADGVASVPFRNATSDYGRRVIGGVLKHPDGVGGVYAERFDMTRKAQAIVLSEANSSSTVRNGDVDDTA